ncbi:hypothetical protein BJ742DRAFT_767151 [Cladochytrium replicatum]|nr:hypothetical protein BJ742DRAFT_767151 [Cladochytrium replicatum]
MPAAPVAPAHSGRARSSSVSSVSTSDDDWILSDFDQSSHSSDSDNDFIDLFPAVSALKQQHQKTKLLLKLTPSPHPPLSSASSSSSSHVSFVASSPPVSARPPLPAAQRTPSSSSGLSSRRRPPPPRPRQNVQGTPTPPTHSSTPSSLVVRRTNVAPIPPQGIDQPTSPVVFNPHDSAWLSNFLLRSSGRSSSNTISVDPAALERVGDGQLELAKASSSLQALLELMKTMERSFASIPPDESLAFPAKITPEKVARSSHSRSSDDEKRLTSLLAVEFVPTIHSKALLNSDSDESRSSTPAPDSREPLRIDPQPNSISTQINVVNRLLNSLLNPFVAPASPASSSTSEPPKSSTHSRWSVRAILSSVFAAVAAAVREDEAEGDVTGQVEVDDERVDGEIFTSASRPLAPSNTAELETGLLLLLQGIAKGMEEFGDFAEMADVSQVFF